MTCRTLGWENGTICTLTSTTKCWWF